MFFLLVCFAGTPPYEKLTERLTKKSLLADIRQISGQHTTSSLEAFHSVYSHFAPKLLAFSYYGMISRYLFCNLLLMVIRFWLLVYLLLYIIFFCILLCFFKVKSRLLIVTTIILPLILHTLKHYNNKHYKQNHNLLDYKHGTWYMFWAEKFHDKIMHKIN